MERRISPCPNCGKMIYSHAVLCPYCKRRTGFKPADKTETPIADAPVAPAASVASAAPAEGKPSKSKKKVSIPYYGQQRLSKYSRATKVKGAIIALLTVVVLILFIAVQMQNRRLMKLSSAIDHSSQEVIDSMANEVSQSGYVIAKFPERDRHCMYYLVGGHMYVFDAVTRNERELKLNEMNPQAVVDYEGSGVLQANISPDDQYIIIVASRDMGNTECGLYQMDAKTQQITVLDRGKVTFDNGEYTVQSGGRTARYDTSGTKLAGLTIEEAEAMPKPATKEEKKKEETSEKVEEEKHETVTEQLEPKVDVVKQPSVPTDIKISPNITAPATNDKAQE